MRVALLFSLLTLLCIGASVPLSLHIAEREPERLFLMCVSGETPLFAGEIRGAPSISGDSLSFYSVEYSATVQVVGAACLIMRPPT